ncbi:DUF4192 family protein [Nonomuraea sp. 10N515B]|uniref:DUF4192 family protein n=1 Tax=Nonomuraea sp. 10N515B TaxID=3457422 RepID=UPI003FCD51F0
MDTANMPAPQPSPDHAGQLRHLTRQLAGHLADQLSIQPCPPVEQLVGGGLARLRRTINATRHGTSVDDATAIRLAMDLHIVRIRDEAWLAVQDDPATMTTTLLHLAERTPPSFAAPIGTLRAIAAWYRGELDTAARAVAEVLAIRPFYSMAQLLTLALRCNVPPEKLQVRMPTAAEIDLVMGPPRPEWLQHLQRSLTDYLGPAGPRTG